MISSVQKCAVAWNFVVLNELIQEPLFTFQMRMYGHYGQKRNQNDFFFLQTTEKPFFMVIEPLCSLSI